MVHEEVVEDQELIASDIHLVSLETKSSHKQAVPVPGQPISDFSL